MTNRDALHTASESLIAQVSHWSAARWEGTENGVSRVQRMHTVLQRIADVSAECEGVPLHSVPVLTPTVAIVDQMRVLLRDAVNVVDEARAAMLTRLCWEVSAEFSPSH